MLVRFGKYCRIKPVGVFVRAAFPRVMRFREEEARVDFGLEGLIEVEFGPVVDRDRAHGMELRVNELARGRCRRARRGAAVCRSRDNPFSVRPS